MRTAQLIRNTSETQIGVRIDLDGTGKRDIDVPNGFFAHMLDLFSKHSLIDLEIKAKGDTWIDDHHLIEDIGIVLGEAMLKAIGDKKGINRYGFFILPMDESLVLVSLDFSGRFAFSFDAKFEREKINDFSTELVYDFFDAVAKNAKLSLHIKMLNQGMNDHHRIEAIFKAFARAVRAALKIDDKASEEIPSTKGVL